MRGRLAGALAVSFVVAVLAPALALDTALVNGKIVVYDGQPAQALLVRDGSIAAIGESAEITGLARPGSRIINLAGRTVIPGLIDSHIHAIRAGLSYSTEVHWIGVRSLAEALDRLRSRARITPKGGWLVVAGGWNERQFAEGRFPTRAEIAAAVPEHRVYVQLAYSRVLLSAGGYDALGLPQREDLARRLTIERDGEGRPTGWLTGDARAISDLFDLLAKPSPTRQMEGTRAFFRELNAAGLTGVLDPGGYNLPVSDYEALFAVWRAGALTLRVRYSLSAPRRGRELEDFQSLLAMMPMGFGDEWLRFNGIGENVTWGMYNNERPSEADKEQLYTVLRWAAPRRMTATFHWHNERSVPHLLEVLERINAETPIASLRWSVAHLNDASLHSLARMKAMNVGWLVQNAFYFRGETFLVQQGLEAARLSPAIRRGLDMGVRIGAGTDAHRVMWYAPFVSLQWMLDGTTVGGVALRTPDELLDRLEALRLYTEGSAWFSFDEDRRGSLAVGKLADLAVLDQDYLTVPTERIGGTRSLLTMVGGRIVYAAGPYAALEEKTEP